MIAVGGVFVILAVLAIVIIVICVKGSTAEFDDGCYIIEHCVM